MNDILRLNFEITADTLAVTLESCTVVYSKARQANDRQTANRAAIEMHCLRRALKLIRQIQQKTAPPSELPLTQSAQQ